MFSTDSLRELLREVQVPGAVQPIADALDTLDNLPRSFLRLDVLHDNWSQLAENWRQLTSGVLGEPEVRSLRVGVVQLHSRTLAGVAVQVTLRTVEEAVAEPLGECRPGALVLLLGPAGLADRLDLLQHLLQDRAAVFVGCSGAAAEGLPALLHGLPLAPILLQQQPDFAWEAAGDLLAFLQAVTAPATARPLQDYAGFSTLEKMAGGLRLVLQQETRANQAQRMLTQQRAGRFQKRPNSSPADVAGQVKNLVQNQFGQFERGVVQKYENYLRPGTGGFSQRVEEELSSLTHLTETKRGQKALLVLPDGFQAHFFQQLSSELRRQISNDLDGYRDTVRQLGQDLEQQLDKAGLPHAAPDFQYLDSRQIGDVLTSALQAERPYEGPNMEEGFGQLVSAARKHPLMSVLMALSPVVALVSGPLTKALSDPSAEGGAPLRIGMPLIALVVLVPLLFVFKGKLKVQKAEHLQLELGKAKDALRAEARRVAAEVQRQWVRMLTEHLRYQQTSNLQTLEATLRDYATRRQGEEEEDRTKFQRQLQGFEGTEKRLGLVARNLDALDKTWSKEKSQLRQSVLTRPRPAGVEAGPLAGPPTTTAPTFSNDLATKAAERQKRLEALRTRSGGSAATDS